MGDFKIPNRGTSHHGLSTRDADGTIAFYDGVLGFDFVFCNVEEQGGGGKANGMRHMFFDMGNDEMFTFFELPKWESDEPDPLQVAASEFHWAFNAGNDDTLEMRRAQLKAAGIPVTEIVQVGVEYPDGEVLDTAHSIYFRDPVNDFLLEFCVFVRNFTKRDLNQKPVFSDNHGGPEFLEAFLGPKRFAEMMAQQAANA